MHKEISRSLLFLVFLTVLFQIGFLTAAYAQVGESSNMAANPEIQGPTTTADEVQENPGMPVFQGADQPGGVLEGMMDGDMPISAASEEDEQPEVPTEPAQNPNDEVPAIDSEDYSPSPIDLLREQISEVEGQIERENERYGNTLGQINETLDNIREIETLKRPEAWTELNNATNALVAAGQRLTAAQEKERLANAALQKAEEDYNTLAMSQGADGNVDTSAALSALEDARRNAENAAQENMDAQSNFQFRIGSRDFWKEHVDFLNESLVFYQDMLRWHEESRAEIQQILDERREELADLNEQLWELLASQP